MKHRFLPERLGLAAFFALAAPVALGQISTPTSQAASEGPAKAPVTVRVGEPVAETVEYGLPGIDRGEPRFEAASLPTSLPLPERARYRPRADGSGDELEAEAAGDPFFLGFTGGEFRPPAGERLDNQLFLDLQRDSEDGRSAPERFAYVMLAERASDAVKAELEAAGARVLGFRPHQAFAIAITADSLPAVLALDAVHWVGYSRNWQKLDPRVTDAFVNLGADERAHMIVSLFDTDLGPASRAEAISATEVAGPGVRRTESAAGQRWSSEGWQQRALEQRGVEVLEYLPSIQSLRVRMTSAQVLEVVGLDFVEYAEAEQRSMPMHDDSQPMIGADYTRGTYDGSWSGQAIAGEIDSGVDIDHTGLNHAWYLGWTFTGDSAWNDNCGHGSHVAGSILALPHAALAELRGGAPGLGFSQNRSFRNVKFMEPNPNPDGNPCIGSGGSSLESRFSLMRNTWSDGQISSPKPHVVNNSWGSGTTPGGWSGTQANSRAVDAEIWNTNQVYVFAAGNSGPGASTLSQEASAKNALSVGNVLPHLDNGVGMPSTLWTSSSRGPTGDARWKPNVVAPGRRIMSVNADTGNGYSSGTGTSMAAPHVTGVVAQMVDRNDFLRYAPARVASLIMATANTKGGVTLSSPNDNHLDLYGAGRVDASRAVLTTSQHGWLNWGFTQGSGQNTMDDFDVAASVERLVVVMHYIEPAASAGAANALVNDFDLVIDRAPFDAAIDQGEYVAQQSNRNNTEIRVIDNPQSGQWRWKIHPVSATTSVRMSVTVHFIHGDPTPNPTLSLSVDDQYVQPNEVVEISATVTNPSHVASAVFLDTTTSTSATLLSATTTLKDGIVADLSDNPLNNGGFEATLGNIRHGTNRRVDWTARWASQGVKTWSVDGDSDNGMNRTAQVQVTVDGTPPGIVTGFQSSSHFSGTWYSANDVNLVWNAASDNLSGIAGYSRTTTTSPSMPGQTMNLGAVQMTEVGPLASNQSGWYVNLRAVDRSGNWSNSYASAGPFLIDTVKPGTVSGFVSTSHLTNTWTNNPNVTVKWSAAPDAHSGIGGYSVYWSSTNPGQPATVQDIGPVTTTVQAFVSSHLPRWCNLRAVDAVGNWSDNYASAGPFLIDVTAPTLSTVQMQSEVGPVTETTSPIVPISIAASDAHSGLESMRLINDGGSWSPWMPFQSTLNWSLLAHGGDSDTGTRNVLVQVRDVAGNTSVSKGASVYYYVPHWIFGAAGNGSMGAPTIDMKGVAAPGAVLTVAVGNTAAPIRRLVLGTSANSWNGLPLPLDLGLLGSPGNHLHISPDLILYQGGAGQVEVPLSANPNFVGQTFYLQWALLGDPSGLPIVTTPALGFEMNGL
ncbi:MAG: S8 family serine peptidase [Planctomycetaceae bacterium]|nr:S8 family serine peptidase [Planctomycetaceae bacterium]